MAAEQKKKSDYLVEVKDLKEYFPVKTGLLKTIPLKAVDGVSFNIRPGETLGLVGESGCGKTTVGRTLLRLYEPTGGEFRFDGELVTDRNIFRLRKKMQMVFQDPYSSLDPRMTVEDIIGEPLDVHHLYTTKKDRHDKVMHLMELVGLNAEHATRYAHDAMRMSSPAARDSVSALPARWQSTRASSSAMSLCRLSTSRFRHRSSICSRICRTSLVSRTSLSRMTCLSSTIFLTALRSCTSAGLSR